MAGRQGPGGSAARRAALCGVFAALALVFMLAGGYLTVFSYATPAFAGLCLIPVAAELGRRAALLCYAAISLLAFLLVFGTDPEQVLLFVFLLGHYPVFYPALAKIRSRALRYAVKFALLNGAAAVTYAILLYLLVSPALLQELAGYSPVYIAALLLMANAAFFVYDILTDRVILLYAHKFRKYLFK